MKNILRTPKLSLAPVALLMLCMVTSSSAITFYNEDFVPVDDTVNTKYGFGDPGIGWTVYNEAGTDLSSLRGDPAWVSTVGTGYIAGSSANVGNAYALIASDFAGIEAGYTDVVITFNQGGNDRTVDDLDLGWRVLVEVGGMWYASNFDEMTGFGNKTAALADSIWSAWETDLSDGYDGRANFGTAGALASGDVTGFGLLAIDGSTAENDSLTLYSYDVSGVAGNAIVPEPSTYALLAGMLGLAAAVLRRRR